MNTATPSSTTALQATADRLISLTKTHGGDGMSEPMQAIVGDILRALEADGIYQAAPAGFPCSMVTVSALGEWNNLSGIQRVNPIITFVHVITDAALLSLLQKLSQTSWRDYLDGKLRGLCLNEQASVSVHANEIDKPSKYLYSRNNPFIIQHSNNCRYSYATQDGNPDVLQCCGFFWDYDW